MSGLKEKLGIKVAVILLFSVFILAGLNATRAYGQPLDSPIYSNTKTKAVELMNAPADTKLVAGANGPAAALATITTVNCGDCEPTCKADCPVCLPVMPPGGELVYILTLTGGACWAILRKK
jgi:hypothetical protein